jgi:nucleoid DNA-binding protein
MSSELKDRLVNKVVEDLKIKKADVEKVLSFVFMKTLKSFGENNSVELSGFGTFRVSKSKLRKRIAGLEKAKTILETNLQNPDIDLKQKKLTEGKIEGLTEDIERLKQKEL